MEMGPNLFGILGDFIQFISVLRPDGPVHATTAEPFTRVTRSTCFQIPQLEMYPIRVTEGGRSLFRCMKLSFIQKR